MKYFDDMKQPVISTLLFTFMKNLTFNMEKLSMSCGIYAMLQGIVSYYYCLYKVKVKVKITL